VLAWWPSAVAVQAEAANHRELLRSRAVVVSVAGKVAPLSAARVDHEGERKRTTDDVSVRLWLTSKPGMLWSPGMSLAGALLTGQVVSGVEVARAWSWLLHGTWEPVAPTGRPGQWRGVGPRSVAHGRSPSSGNCEGLSTGAGHRGGPSRSSGAGPVMGLERRGRVVRAGLAVNRLRVGGAG